jgi:hypothetical protein
VECGREIRLFDPRRNPQDWTDLISPTECAVFFKDRVDSSPLAPDGQPYASGARESCVVFSSLDAAQRFCEAKIHALPQLRCEIYDSHGLAHPPLVVLVHPDFERKEDGGPIGSRRRTWGAGALFLVSLLFFWMAARSSSSRDLAIFLGINCILLALRFLYWDFGVKQKERERRKRLEDHRKIERGDA